jgi:hypothetical protein
MLSMSVIVMGIGDELPKTSNSQPLISFFLLKIKDYTQTFSAIYIMGEIMLSAVASASTVLIMLLSRQALSGVRPPMWMKRWDTKFFKTVTL